MEKNNPFKSFLVVAMIVIGLMLIFSQFTARQSAVKTIGYSQFMEEVRAGHIAKVVIEENTLYITTAEGIREKTTAPNNDPWLISDLLKNGVKFEVVPKEEPSLLLQILINWGPMILMIGVWIFFMRQMQGGGGGGRNNPFSFGKSRAKPNDNLDPIFFADVAGCDEAKEEVMEVVEFLRDPTKFQKLGGRIPKGILMVGNPGTGKTLLARAVAGEAKVPFLSISGSDFVEMFVGVGASRVRDMFEQAKEKAPCIIFIDEIDAVGRQRGAGMGGGNDEREQTLNQLLVEMDGFAKSATPVIVFAATNRPDVLDPALLRPGRFDRQVVMPLPDVRGREQILLVHMRKVSIASDVVASILARGTPGFSGADLANLVNEAALFATRKNKAAVEMSDFELAKDKILMGAERKTAVMPKEVLRNTAYHESGHAVVASVLKGLTDPVHKVTIIPRGRALGVTMQLPEGDRYSQSKEQLHANLAVLFGGRIAEDIFMHDITTGASNDFERATEIARRMVTQWGMAEGLGAMVYAESDGEVFLGRQIAAQKVHSEETLRKVDAAIRKILDTAYARAQKIIEEHRPQMERMTKALLEWETIDAEQIADIMAGREPQPPKPVVPPTPPKDTTVPVEAIPTPTGIHPDSKNVARDIGMSNKK